jgi:hypothetical protein
MAHDSLRKLAIGAVILAVAVVAFLSWRPASTDADGPVSHWVFDRSGVSGTAVKDQTGRLPGTLSAAPEFSDPKPTTALELRGSHGGIVLREAAATGDDCLPKEAFSAVAWVRLDQGSKWGGIVSAVQHNGRTQRGFVLGYNEKVFSFGLSTRGRDSGDGKLTYLAGKTPFEKGRWYHVAATYDGKTMTLYVNGKAEATSTEQSGPIHYDRQQAFVLGAFRDENRLYPLRGALREVLVFHRTLGAAEVARDFEANAALSKADPVAEKPHFVVHPYLQYPTQTGITVMWETSVPGTSVVKYGVGALSETKAGPENATLHEVPLAGLKPNTPYLYQVSSTDAAGNTLTGPLLTFQTAVEANSAYSFVLIGDTQKNPIVTGKIAQLAWERRPNFVVHLGDVVDNGPDKNEWVDELFGPCRELFGRVAVFPCIGNHEKNHAHYYKYFALPEPEYYYRYRYGNADFFVLDTNKKVGPDTEQYKWLETELAKSDAKWKFVYHHHPAYSSDADDYGNTWKGQPTSWGDKNVRQLVALYEKYHVDFVFNGHIHLYERTWPIHGGKVDRKNGVVYITSGGGGGKLEEVSPIASWFKAQSRTDYHFCYVTVHGGRLGFHAFDHRGNLFDTFEVEK